MPDVRHLPSTNSMRHTLCGVDRSEVIITLNRVTCGLCIEKETELVNAKTAELLNDVSRKAATATNIDELVQKYSVRLQEIYDQRIAGDHTFTGVLTDFLRELTK